MYVVYEDTTQVFRIGFLPLSDLNCSCRVFFKHYNGFQLHWKCNLILYFGLQDAKLYRTCLFVQSHFLTPLSLASKFSPTDLLFPSNAYQNKRSWDSDTHYFIRKVPPQKLNMDFCLWGIIWWTFLSSTQHQ